MRPNAYRHRGHAYCGSTCVPTWLHDEFDAALGVHAGVFDLLAWYPAQDATRGDQVIPDAVLWWRKAFRAAVAQKVAPTALAPAGATIVTPRGLVYPCPHTPRCLTTWGCGRKQQADALDST